MIALKKSTLESMQPVSMMEVDGSFIVLKQQDGVDVVLIKIMLLPSKLLNLRKLKCIRLSQLLNPNMKGATNRDELTQNRKYNKLQNGLKCSKITSDQTSLLKIALIQPKA